MSDDKPFAEAMPKEEDGYPVKIHGAAEYYCASKNSAYLDAHNITAKATARERKAAAQALRELAASVRAETGVRAPKPSDPFWRDHFAAMADREADAIEKAAP